MFHQGPLFSDFKFHSIGVRDFGLDCHDLGRYVATQRLEDKYKFRTAPLVFLRHTQTVAETYSGSPPGLYYQINEALVNRRLSIS